MPASDEVVAPLPEVARYAAPRVMVMPVREVVPPERVGGAPGPGHYQAVVLDVQTGELRFHESTQHRERWNPQWRSATDVPRETWHRWHPGTRFSWSGPQAWFEPVPALLRWELDLFPYLGVDQADALLAAVAPHAQALLDGLFEVGGDLDWSADALHAGRNVRRLCSQLYGEPAPREVDTDLVDYGEIVQRFPQAYDPKLLVLSLGSLAVDCQAIARALTVRFPEVQQEFGKPTLRAGRSEVELQVLGVRAWYRTVVLDDPVPALDFVTWAALEGRLTTGAITSDSTDAELDAWAQGEHEYGRSRGVRLLGVEEAARAHRDELRDIAWDRLDVVGWRVVQQAKDRAERDELMAAARRWGRSFGEIGRQAHMTRQRAKQILGSDKSAKDTLG